MRLRGGFGVKSGRPIPVLMMVRELNLGGIECDVSKLARNLDPSRFQPHVAAFLPYGVRRDEIAAARIPILHLPVTSLKSASALQGALRLFRYLREHAIQVVHAFDAPTGIFAIPVARLARVPVAVSSQLWIQGDSRPLRLAYRLSTAVYANCEAVKKQLVEEKRVPPERVFVCYNGVETRIFYPSRPDGPPDPGAPVVIGAVAVFRPEKDLVSLIDAFARLRETYPRTRLVLAGAGPTLQELEARRADLRLADCCDILPPPANVADLMRNIDIFVSCSRHEAFSNAILESMACGCCPVGSRVGGTPELINHGERGLLFEAGNVDDLCAKLSRLLANPSERREFASAAAAFARDELGIHVAARRLAGAYMDLLGEARHLL